MRLTRLISSMRTPFTTFYHLYPVIFSRIYAFPRRLVINTAYQLAKRPALTSCHGSWLGFFSEFLDKENRFSAYTSPRACLQGLCKPKYASCPPYYNVHASVFWSSPWFSEVQAILHRSLCPPSRNVFVSPSLSPLQLFKFKKSCLTTLTLFS